MFSFWLVYWLPENGNCGWALGVPLVHGLQEKAYLTAQVVTPEALPRPQESFVHCKQEELPGILPPASLNSGVLGPVLPARHPKQDCPHFAKRESEAQAQRSQRANLSTCDPHSTLAWP